MSAGCDDNLGAPGGGGTYSADACAAAEGSESCQDFYDSNAPAACIATGTLANGAPCGIGGQCASTFCASDPWDICGTCAALPTVGASCFAQADCGRNLACIKSPGSTVFDAGTCTQWVFQGGTCDASRPCASGLSCVGEIASQSQPGICKPMGEMVGVACDVTRATMPGCDGTFGLACIPSGAGTNIGTCQQIQLVGPGATCGAIGTPTTAVADCSAGALCIKASSSDKTGTCVAAAADGAPCDQDPTVGPSCLSPARCVSTSASSTAGICTMPNAASCT